MLLTNGKVSLVTPRDEKYHYLQNGEAEIEEKAEIKTSDMCPEMQEDAINFAVQASDTGVGYPNTTRIHTKNFSVFQLIAKCNLNKGILHCSNFWAIFDYFLK